MFAIPEHISSGNNGGHASQERAAAKERMAGLER